MSHESKGKLRYPFAALLILGLFVLYPILVKLCTDYDGVPWTLYPTTGTCWSEGGDYVFTNLGIATGICIGVGLTGCIVSQILYKKHHDPFRNVQNVRSGTNTGYVTIA